MNGVPDFIMPEDISKMDQVEIFKLVHKLRDRRLETRRAFEVVERARKQSNEEWLQKELDKLYLRMAKKYVTVDKALDDLEELANKIAGLRLQRNDDAST